MMLVNILQHTGPSDSPTTKCLACLSSVETKTLGLECWTLHGGTQVWELEKGQFRAEITASEAPQAARSGQ